jgi:hypothetical protein
MVEWERAVNAGEKYADKLDDAKGSLYNVDLKVSPDDLLDWDAPLSEQSEKVQKALGPYAKEYDNPEQAIRDFLNTDYAKSFPDVKDVKWARTILEDPDYDVVEDGADWLASQMRAEQGSSFYNLLGGRKAGQLYERMSRSMGGAENASTALREAGIPGIRYLDGTSRSAGEGTRNFVIFDDSLVDIKTRNGEALTPVQREAAVGEMMGGDAASRMARAKEGGFNRDIYHKTWGENFEGDDAFSAFDPEKMQQSDYGYAGRGVYATPKPLQNAYGNVTMPLKTNIKNPYIRTGDNWEDELDPYQWIPKNSERLGGNKESSTAWTEMMKSKGYDGFIDESSANGEIVIFDPANIRSVNAQFDPSKASSGNLLAGAAGAGIATKLITDTEDSNINSNQGDI